MALSSELAKEEPPITAVDNLEENIQETEVMETAQPDNNGNADDFLGDDDSDDDDFVVTIGEIKPNLSFQKNAQQVAGNVATLAGGKPDMDGTPLHKGVPIYDLDLASMEDKPWRKPGADLTDYFNYGFNEDTWNQYCERQKKLRTEFGNNQEAINRSIFNGISLVNSTNTSQLSAMSGGRQLVNILASGSIEKPKSNKVVIDLSKPPPVAESQVSVIRTIIGGNTDLSSNTSLMSNSPLIPLGNNDPSSQSQITTIGSSSSNLFGLTGVGASPGADFSVPPPSATIAPAPAAPPVNFSVAPSITSDFSKPPPLVSSTAAPTVSTPLSSSPILSKPPPINVMSTIKTERPPGVDEPDIPGITTPPPGLPSFPALGALNPPSSQLGRFNPSVPPPAGTGIPGMNVPPPSLFPQQQFMSSSATGSVLYSTRPQPLFPPRANSGYGSSLGMESSMVEGRRSRDYRERERDRDRDYGRDRDRGDYSSGDSADESYRRKRRRRSRSTSVERSSRRRKEDKDRDRDPYTSSTSRRYDDDASARTSKRKSEREKERSTGDSKRRSSRRSAERDTEKSEHGGEVVEERSERRRKKHEKSEKERDKEKL